MRLRKNRPEVEINYMKRLGTSQYYFEVWVRSAVRPDVKQGTIVERSPDERRDLMIAAGALCENLLEKYGGGQDPDRVARLTGDTYDRMNPSPRIGNERPL